MRFGITQILSSVTMTGSVSSWGFDLQQAWAYSFQAVWSGSPLGTIKLQASNENVIVGPTGTNPAQYVNNWTDLNSNISSTTGVSGSILWNIQEPGYRWVRLAYSHGSGNGFLSVFYMDKSF